MSSNKKNRIFFALLLWIPLQLFSQNATNQTVNLPFETAKQVALDLLELDRLTHVDQLNALVLEKYKMSFLNAQAKAANKTLQIHSLLNTIGVLEAQLKAEKSKKPAWFKRLILLAGVFAGGYFFGNL